MPGSNDPIRLHEVGPYAELCARPNPDGLVVLTVPPFQTMLPFLAQKLGRPLTPEEAEAKRQTAPSIVVTPEQARGMAATLPGYLEVPGPDGQQQAEPSDAAPRGHD
jgi:hypothetical protein